MMMELEPIRHTSGTPSSSRESCLVDTGHEERVVCCRQAVAD
jgi:hypothetical protein